MGDTECMQPIRGSDIPSISALLGSLLSVKNKIEVKNKNSKYIINSINIINIFIF